MRKLFRKKVGRIARVGRIFEKIVAKRRKKGYFPRKMMAFFTERVYNEDKA